MRARSRLRHRWILVRLPLSRYLIAALAIWLCAALVFAQPLVEVPALNDRVVDTTDALSVAQKQELDGRLSAFERRKGSQIALLIVRSTQPETIEQYAIRVVEQWKLGRKKVDDGAILLIAKEDRTLRIEVGYGLEGALNDATCKRIIDELIVPQLRNNDLYKGVSVGLDAMMRVVDGEALPPPAQLEELQLGNAGLLPVIFIAAVLIGAVMRRLLGRGKGALITGALVGFAVWLFTSLILFALFSALISAVISLVGAHIGGGGGSGGWGGGGGRGGGGGFRGGGGGFGGGGASGRW
jgi:uncharacterized protein